MASIRICGKKSIRKIDFLKDIDLDKICVWERVPKDVAEKVGLRDIGDSCIPLAKFGRFCHKNVNGYSYPDKTRPKERRVVSSYYMHPYGNKNSNEILVDVTRECYRQVKIDPFEIAIELQEDGQGLYVGIICDERVKKQYLKEAMNIMLELFGGCYVGDDVSRSSKPKRTRVNWKLLPKGERPSMYIQKIASIKVDSSTRFMHKRLDYIEHYEIDEIVEGINSFQGYFGYLTKEYCVLESAVYGNATYIIKRENWVELTKKSKAELLKEAQVIEKIEHNKNWEMNMRRIFKSLGVGVVS